VFRPTHIRTKLAIALAIPMVALVAVAGFEVIDSKAEVDQAKDQAALAETALGPGSLVVDLQNERNRAAIDLIGLGAAAELAVETNAEARGLTDPAAVVFREETDGRGGLVREAFEPAWAAFEDLEDLRADIDAYDGPMDSTNEKFADEVFGRYSAIVEAFFDGTSQVVSTVDDAELRNGTEIVDASTRQTDVQARMVRSIVQATITARLDEPAVQQEVAALFDRSQNWDDTIRANSNGAYAGVGDETFAEAGLQSFNRQIESYLAGNDVEITPLLSAVASDPTIGYTGLRAKAGDLLIGEAANKQDEAVSQMMLLSGIALGGLLLALMVIWLASRSITRPLRSLKTQAEDMAGSRLPAAVRQILDTPAGEDVVIPEVEPITVKTRDEVSEVATALSDVQSSAVDLAVEQAVLRRNISDSYINLGRRNQNLLSRQLDFITELERNETDPDNLEGLFRLDHLATRMRRNAESLLVLAGIEPPRQWSAPVRLADVVRAALGEVEDYQRCVVRHLEPASVTGAVATDVAHVLAELIENALSFSPPDQSVEVKGRLTTSGYTVAITDNGLGMSTDDVERANRRLAGEESFTVAPSRYLGHYVAGHLASRLGIVVELQESPAGGITARVDVPMGLLADDELDRTLAKAPSPEPVPEPVVAGPTAASVSTETTTSGLPRRGGQMVAVEDSELDQGDQLSPVPIDEPGEQSTPSEPEPALAADTTPSPVASPGPSAQPISGFGGLAVSRPSGPSLYTVAATQGRTAVNGEATDELSAASGVATPGGLARRVPGAQRPDAGMASRAPEPTDSEPARTSPEDVYSFLSNFQSGVAQGRADAASDTPTSQEEGR
jgi:signal transduction histidine kinase